MRDRALLFGILLLLVATVSFAHGGHNHSFLGTIKSVQEDRLLVTTTTNKDVTFVLTANTAVTKGTQPATRADLVAGKRVAVYVENDGKTAKTVKIAK